MPIRYFILNVYFPIFPISNPNISRSPFEDKANKKNRSECTRCKFINKGTSNGHLRSGYLIASEKNKLENSLSECHYSDVNDTTICISGNSRVISHNTDKQQCLYILMLSRSFEKVKTTFFFTTIK